MSDTTGSTNPGPGEGSPGVGATGTADTDQSAQTQIDALEATKRELVAQRDALKGKNTALESRRFMGDDEFAAYEKLQAADVARQTKILEDQGEFDKLKNQLTENHTNELSAKDGVITNLRGELSRQLVDREIMSASTGKAHDPAKVVKLLSGNIKLDFNEDGGHVVGITDDSGNKVYNDNGDPISLSEFVTKYLKDNPDLQASRAVSGSGATGETGNTSGSVGGTIIGSGASATRVPTMAEQSKMTSLDEIRKARAAIAKAR